MILADVANQRLTIATVWFTMAAASVYLFIFEPGKTGFFPVCPFRALTGFTCPGCGSTRALHQLLHGDLVGAFKLNPLMMLLLPFLFYAFVRHTNVVMRGRPIIGNQLNAKYIWALFAVVLFFWTFRNTHFYPFVS